MYLTYEKTYRKELTHERQEHLSKHRHVPNRKEIKAYAGIRGLYTSYDSGVFASILCTAHLPLVQRGNIAVGGPFAYA